MGKSIFAENAYCQIEKNVLKYLNDNLGLIPVSILNSPRSIGDKIEEIIRNNFDEIIGIKIQNYNGEFARRSMSDMAFGDYDSNFYSIDVKTHNLETKFNMPNIISVERIARFYRDDKNYFVILKIDYAISGGLKINAVHFTPIEHISWNCLTLGALGWGQIQIANANNVLIDRTTKRKDWMLYFCEKMLADFYPNEVSKISERIIYFQVEKQFWEEKN